MLELKSISYSVREGDGELGILNDISLTIPDHRLVVFTGPNGGGKTTLAKIIMGLVTPTSGQILWNGQDITSLGITERARLGISYCFQPPRVSAKIWGRISEAVPRWRIVPSPTTMTSSAREMMRSWWEMMIMVPLPAVWICSKVSVSRAKLQRSMPASGSSKIISWAFRASMEAISIRLTSPQEREASTSRSR